MEKKLDPVCGETSDSHSLAADTCSECAAKENPMIEKESPDTEVYLNARDYSAPECYPGY